ncbi:hypothetical protein NLX71_05265 [Paenibacillus sp. MZ04-78.2]|uniref:DUF6060 domain-containing protein n=1 Tax=Paenibacillus sp. MZ04-78.2 TaxID=2962034 RepID=UPI0020B75CFD|nr:hypothetical protein [Paenibacillus sp. MZ04-78.2]MCP3772729.1 hypothetical protein [Paenibacillus sp. MZ04-78.2]
MKRLVALFFLFIFMLSLTFGPNAQNLLAATNDELYSFTTKDGEPALYDHANKAYVVKAWTADGKEISLSEYKSIIEGSNKLNTQNAITLAPSENQKTNQQVEKINALNYINMNYYEKDLTWAATATPQKVSPSVDCPSWQPAPCPVQVTDSVQSSESFSTGVDAGDKNYIRVNAGFTWQETSQSQVGVTYQIPLGQRGYVTFAPYFNHTRGYIHYAYSDQSGYHYLGKSKMKFAQSPKVLSNGLADGVYSVVKY